MESLKEQLRLHEGYKLKPYKCPAGFNTIGIGHNYDANPLPPDIAAYLAAHGRITDEMADRLLEADIAAATADCRKLYPGFDGFPQVKRYALIDMMFNMGLGTLRKFTTTNLFINSGRWIEASENLKKTAWYKQVGKRAKTVCRMLKSA
jgi:lysozyme